MALDLVDDALEILTDEETFGQSITVTAPDGTVAELVGFGTEIGQTLEPETGQLVSGSRASVALPFGPFRAAFGVGVIPTNVNTAVGKPWVVAFADALGVTRSYKVIEVMPDLRVGVITCLLGDYRP